MDLEASTKFYRRIVPLLSFNSTTTPSAFCRLKIIMDIDVVGTTVKESEVVGLDALFQSMSIISPPDISCTVDSDLTLFLGSIQPLASFKDFHFEEFDTSDIDEWDFDATQDDEHDRKICSVPVIKHQNTMAPTHTLSQLSYDRESVSAIHESVLSNDAIVLAEQNIIQNQDDSNDKMLELDNEELIEILKALCLKY